MLCLSFGQMLTSIEESRADVPDSSSICQNKLPFPLFFSLITLISECTYGPMSMVGSGVHTKKYLFNDFIDETKAHNPEGSKHSVYLNLKF